MKKYQAFMLLVVLCFLFVSVHPNPQVLAIEQRPLTQEQQKVVQMDTDILGMCIIEESINEIKYGFTTEHIITHAFGECEQEMNNVIKTLHDIDVSDKKIISILNSLYEQAVDGLDKMRNNVALDVKREWMNKHSM